MSFPPLRITLQDILPVQGQPVHYPITDQLMAQVVQLINDNRCFIDKTMVLNQFVKKIHYLSLQASTGEFNPWKYDLFIANPDTDYRLKRMNQYWTEATGKEKVFMFLWPVIEPLGIVYPTTGTDNAEGWVKCALSHPTYFEGMNWLITKEHENAKHRLAERGNTETCFSILIQRFTEAWIKSGRSTDLKVLIDARGFQWESLNPPIKWNTDEQVKG